MNQHREIFNEILLTFGYTAKQVCAWAAGRGLEISESRLSRFRTSKLDLEAGEFFLIMESLPEEAQDYFWAKKLKKLPSLTEQVQAMDFDKVADVLESISSRLKSSKSSKLNVITEEKPSEVFI
ncbi:MAG TPA: hypothetical protein V6D33_10125 [Cyanophyceae cyanobacterium]|jgi:hypothetical protein